MPTEFTISAESLQIDIWTVATSLVISASILLILYGAAVLNGRRAMRARLAMVALDAVVVSEVGQLSEPAVQRAFAGIGRLVAHVLPPQLVTRMRLTSVQAGMTNRGMADILLGVRALTTVSAGGLAYAFAVSGQGTLSFIGAGVIGCIGIFGIDLYLRSRADARRRAADRDLPTVLDVLTLTLAAGLGFDNALEMILIHFKGPLVEELLRYLYEIRELGAQRTIALRETALRLGDSPDMVDFADAVNRSQQMGTGLLAAVESQVILLRQERHRRIASAAQRAPIRMLIPMTLFMLPVLMLIVLAPVALRVFNAAGGLH